MYQAYIAYADQTGLRALVTDTPAVSKALRDSLWRSDHHCGWGFRAVLDPGHARQVQEEMRHGDRTVALQMLHDLARDWSSLDAPTFSATPLTASSRPSPALRLISRD